MLDPVIQKNDRKAKWLIGIFSLLVFIVIVILGRVKLEINADFDVHIFAKVNAIINSFVTALLIAALIAVKLKHYVVHMRLMLTAMVLIDFISALLYCTSFIGWGYQIWWNGYDTLCILFCIGYAHSSCGIGSSFYLVHCLSRINSRLSQPSQTCTNYMAGLVLCFGDGGGGLFDD